MAETLEPLTDAEWPEEIAGLLDGFAGQLNVYRTMAHNPALLRAWAPLRDHLVRNSALGPQLSEVVILRVGLQLGSDYEWAHHVARARKIGMTDARIHSLRGAPSAMDATDALIAGAVDELLDRSQLVPPTRAALLDRFGPHGTLDLIATVGFYKVLGCILKTFDTPVDDEIRAALQADPID